MVDRCATLALPEGAEAPAPMAVAGTQGARDRTARRGASGWGSHPTAVRWWRSRRARSGHPSAGPHAYYADLAQRLAAEGTWVWVIGGRERSEIAAQIVRTDQGDIRDLTGPDLRNAILALAAAQCRRFQRFRAPACRGRAWNAGGGHFRPHQPLALGSAQSDRRRDRDRERAALPAVSQAGLPPRPSSVHAGHFCRSGRAPRSARRLCRACRSLIQAESSRRRCRGSRNLADCAPTVRAWHDAPVRARFVKHSCNSRLETALSACVNIAFSLSDRQERPIIGASSNGDLGANMNSVKTLLLGTAAGLVAVAGAQAADMPVKAAPVQYVKICSLYGDGFYYIPGTDTCLKLGGYLRVQAEYNAGAGGVVDRRQRRTAASQGRFTRDLTNDINYRVRAVTSWDIRQQTEYGTLRTYIRFGVENTTPAATGGGTDRRLRSGIARSSSLRASRWAGRSRSSTSSPTAAPTATTTCGSPVTPAPRARTSGPIPPSSATASPARCRWKTPQPARRGTVDLTATRRSSAQRRGRQRQRA